MGSYAKIKFMNEQNSRDFEKFKNSRAGQFFVSQNKKENKKNLKGMKLINLILFSEMCRMKNS